MKTGYQIELDRLRWTPEGKEALLRAVTQPLHPSAPVRRPLRTALLAAAIACLLVVGVGAAVMELPVLQRYFGGGNGYGQSGALVGRSATSGGWTLTLTDCVGDDHYLVLGFELEAPEGTVLDPEEWQGSYPEEHLAFPGLDGGQAWQWYDVADDDPTDNRRRYALWIEHMAGRSGGSSINGQEMELTVEGVGHFTTTSEGRLEYVSLCGEVWELGTLTLSYPDRTLRMDPGLPVTVLDVPARITHLEVSPIGVDVWLEGEALRDHDARYPWGQCMSLPEVELYDKAGALLEPDFHTPFGVRGGSGCNSGAAPGLPGIHINQSYGYLLDMDNLDHVDICGVSIPLSPASPPPGEGVKTAAGE